MEENKVVEMNEVKETAMEEVQESKSKGILKKIGSGIKRNWKPIAIGAGAFVAGVILGSRKSGSEDSEETPEFDEMEGIATDDSSEMESF